MKRSFANVFAMFLTLILGVGAAMAADENKKEGKKEKDSTNVSGVVKAVDAEKKTVTLEVKAKKNNTEEKVLTLAADGSVKIAGKAATLADLKVGEKATAKLNEKGEVVSLTSGKKEKTK